MSADDALADALLAELSAHPDGIPLARLRKRLDVRMSVLMRTLAWLGEDAIGGVPGAGLVRVEAAEGRETVRLTGKGAVLAADRKTGG